MAKLGKYGRKSIAIEGQINQLNLKNVNNVHHIQATTNVSNRT